MATAETATTETSTANDFGIFCPRTDEEWFLWFAGADLETSRWLPDDEIRLRHFLFSQEFLEVMEPGKKDPQPYRARPHQEWYALNYGKRNVVVGSRRVGKSVGVAMTNISRQILLRQLRLNTLLSGDTEKRAKRLWRKTYLPAYLSLAKRRPNWIPPNIVKENSGIDFVDPSRTLDGKPLITHSVMVLATTSAESRGDGGDMVHWTEAAHTKNDEAFQDAMEGSDERGEMIFTKDSTPNGRLNSFGVDYLTDGNGWTKGSFNWRYNPFWDDEWAEETRARRPLFFDQEHDCKFLRTGNPVFGDYFEDEAEDPIRTEYDGHVLIFREPEEGVVYCAGADTGGAQESGSGSVCIIGERDSGEQVAEIRGYMPPRRFARFIRMLAMRYNFGQDKESGVWYIENQGPGVSTCERLEEIGCPGAVWWETTGANRTPCLLNYDEALMHGHVTIRSKPSIIEHENFIYSGPQRRMQAATDFNDDAVLAGMMFNEARGVSYGAGIVA